MKKGDIVICIDNENIHYIKQLILGGKYVISNVISNNLGDNEHIFVYNNGQTIGYHYNRFKLLSEIRSEKLKKLNEKR